MSAIFVSDNIESTATQTSKFGYLLRRLAAGLNLLARRRQQGRVPTRALRSADHEIRRLHRIMHEHSPAFRPGRR